jgi:DNA primase
VVHFRAMEDRFVEDLKSRVEIVDVVRKYAELKKSGKNFMCRSPFRNERTPSFCVSPDKQFWYDFGSSEGGDVISFVERIENLSFPEAVDHLAQIAGVEVPKNFRSSGVSKEKKTDIFALHRKAAQFFSTQLKSSEYATNYLKQRGITEKIISDWDLGYGGDTADGLTKFLLADGYSPQQIAESGVAFEREFGDKTMRDRFDGRIMIPIHEPRNGEIIAFTGRKLRDEQHGGKYVNSPENPVYHKSSTLFGLHRARKKIRDRDAVILVEGNFDVISAHSAGFDHCVATCGTSLTEEHLRVLRRLTKNILLAFDSDTAGKKATLRSVELCLRMELDPKIVEVSGGKDLDELFQKKPEAAADAIKNAKPALEFLFEKSAEKLLNGTIAGEKKFIDSFFFFLKLVARPIERDEWLKRLSQKLNRSRQIIDDEFQKFSIKEVGYQKEKLVDSSRQKISRPESFVGFLSAFWDFFSPKLNPKILDVFPDGEARDLLGKKILNQDLSEEEQNKLRGWDASQSSLYDEQVSEDNLKQAFESFVQILQIEKEKSDRREAAKNLKFS